MRLGNSLGQVPGEEDTKLAWRPFHQPLSGSLIWCSCSATDDSGLLVHCISGWDRTPLFISLLRLSLWAVSMNKCLGVREHAETILGFTFWCLNYYLQDTETLWGEGTLSRCHV